MVVGANNAMLKITHRKRAPVSAYILSRIIESGDIPLVREMNRLKHAHHI